MQRVFRSPDHTFTGTVTIDVNDGQYSNYMYRHGAGEKPSTPHRYTHLELEKMIIKYVRTRWWVEDVDPDLMVAEGL